MEAHANREFLLAFTSIAVNVFQEAFALRNLAILARDFDIADDVRIVETRAPTFAWTNDICRVDLPRRKL